MIISNLAPDNGATLSRRWVNVGYVDTWLALALLRVANFGTLLYYQLSFCCTNVGRMMKFLKSLRYSWPYDDDDPTI